MAKRLRRTVYGDFSHKIERQYAATRLNSTTFFNHPDSLRARYQRAKRAHLNGMRA